MEFWRKIEECLWDEGIDALNENGSITWDTEKGKDHTIDYKNVAYEGNKLAWYQDEEYGRSLVRVKYPNGIVLSWRPESNHPDWGFRFHFIKWYGDKLIVIYSEKHANYIVKIEHLSITVLYSGYIDNINIKDGIIYIQHSANKEYIHRISLQSKSTLVNEIPHTNLNSPSSTIELKSFSDYFLFHIDPEYNKIK